MLASWQERKLRGWSAARQAARPRVRRYGRQNGWAVTRRRFRPGGKPDNVYDDWPRDKPPVRLPCLRDNQPTDWLSSRLPDQRDAHHTGRQAEHPAVKPDRQPEGCPDRKTTGRAAGLNANRSRRQLASMLS
jgi:hypothetical protein